MNILAIVLTAAGYVKSINSFEFLQELGEDYNFGIRYLAFH